MSRILLEALASRLETTPNALRCRYNRNPFFLPPVHRIPGDRRFWFDEDEVEAWIADPSAFLPKEPRGPGRPRKVDAYTPKPFPPAAAVGNSQAVDSTPKKRGRGRPRKTPPESQLNSG